MTENTRDLAQFGFREYGMAGELLLALADGKWASDEDEMGDGVVIEFNPNSGNVFLVDEDYKVAMLNNGKLENWLNCGNCGVEGFRSDCKDWKDDYTCNDCPNA